MTPEKPKTAIVIGAGAAGLATAARLAHAGLRVTVLEKNEFTGGRCSLIYRDAPSKGNGQDASPGSRYRFDQGPSLLLLPELFHRTFRELGTALEDEGVELRRCEPNYRIWFGDGENVVMSSDLATMRGEVEKWEGVGSGGWQRYLDFVKESGAHYDLSVEHVLLKNFTGLGSMFRWSFLKELLRLHPFESIWTRASKYFFTERLRRVFTFGSMYMGMSPFDAPGTYSLLQYTELAEGIWYPVGGFHRVMEALENVGRRKGMEVRLGCEVEGILLDEKGGSRAKGVRLSGGEVLEADVVVNNSDLAYAYTHLLPPSAATPKAATNPYATHLASRPASCSSISFYWGLSRKVPELETHNIFLADEYKESFDSIFKKHLIPDEPSFYVNVPSRVDPSASPEGKDSVVVLVPVGHLLDDAESDTSPANETANGSVSSRKPTPAGADIADLSPAHQSGIAPSTTQDWPAMLSLARTTILSTIKARTGADLGPLIEVEETNTPQTWKDTFNLDRGAILGLSHSFFNVLCFRPSTRARRPGSLDPLIFGVGAQLGGVLGAGKDGGWLSTVLQVLYDACRGEEGKSVRGLYMVGASAHPGTGVPICLAGGKLVAEQILGDLDLDIPWSATGSLMDGKARGRKGGRRDERLDCVEKPVWLDSWGQWMGLVFVLWTVVLGMVWRFMLLR